MDALGRLAPLIIVLAFFYLLIFLPESRRRKKYNAMLQGLRVNDEVMTKGGIIAKITHIQENVLTIQTGPDRVKIKLDKTGVLNVLSETKKQESTDIDKK